MHTMYLRVSRSELHFGGAGNERHAIGWKVISLLGKRGHQPATWVSNASPGSSRKVHELKIEARGSRASPACEGAGRRRRDE